MIYGFMDPWEPLFVEFDIPKYFETYKNNTGALSKHIVFTNIKTSETLFHQFWKRRAPKNDEDPRHEILKIMDMAAISSRKHEKYCNFLKPRNHKTIKCKPESHKTTKLQNHKTIK